MIDQEEIDRAWEEDRQSFNFKFLGAMLIGAGFWVLFVVVMYAFWYEAAQ